MLNAAENRSTTDILVPCIDDRRAYSSGSEIVEILSSTSEGEAAAWVAAPAESAASPSPSKPATTEASETATAVEMREEVVDVHAAHASHAAHHVLVVLAQVVSPSLHRIRQDRVGLHDQLELLFIAALQHVGDQLKIQTHCAVNNAYLIWMVLE